MTYSNYRSNEVLEAIARKIINQHNPSLLDRPSSIPIVSIMKKVFGLTIVYKHIHNNNQILAETVFADTIMPFSEPFGAKEFKLCEVKAGTVILNTNLKSKRSYGRFRFTCAHELAHWIFDKKYFLEIGNSAATSNIIRSSETDEVIERQADRLACRILMPKNMVKYAFHENRDDPVNRLAKLFGVSRHAMRIRLCELGLAEVPKEKESDVYGRV